MRRPGLFGHVEHIYIAPDKGVPMQAVKHIGAFAFRGLAGDRYALGKGAYSKGTRQTVRDVTLLACEDIAAANASAGTDFTEAETRRNIITSGIDLEELVGCQFTIGVVEMLGIEPADPCGRPSKLSGKPDFKAAFAGRGGLRAQVLTSGLIAVGNTVAAQPG